MVTTEIPALEKCSRHVGGMSSWKAWCISWSLGGGSAPGSQPTHKLNLQSLHQKDWTNKAKGLHALHRNCTSCCWSCSMEWTAMNSQRRVLKLPIVWALFTTGFASASALIWSHTLLMTIITEHRKALHKDGPLCAVAPTIVKTLEQKFSTCGTSCWVQEAGEWECKSCIECWPASIWWTPCIVLLSCERMKKTCWLQDCSWLQEFQLWLECFVSLKWRNEMHNLYFSCVFWRH